jgi:DnaJ like chaperone protein
MGWWGKLVGGTFGFMLGGPIGALLGAAVGHHFDKGLGRLASGREGAGVGDQERVQTVFFTTTFSVMGHLAKIDGRVSEEEIDMARNVMARMELNDDLRQAAIRLFSEGKRTDFPLRDVLDQFRYECHRRQTLYQMFVEIQLFAAYADGVMHPEERKLLLFICKRLGFSQADFERLDAMVRAERHYTENGRESPRATVQDAYAILNVSSKASNDEIKKAYRRLMNQHHPDKLVAKGLPEEMVRIATQKTQEIRTAYERIKKERGI